ncbi:prepilin peptidase [Moraxella cuniculi]|uniref:Prepilin leader peptidase/N-methyltransferase n=1 Tax=Moraxella cuniculi TaxID=34061 RepID=A0A448GVC8_9GAMM|nr:A24 family peptidase [Moraxella cuniculi]VEG12658.1 Pectic enzymes secretion protein outO [Moraxella cuniculi]
MIDTTPTWVWLLTACVGAVAGSFIGMVAHRLPMLMMRQWRADVAEFLSQMPLDGTLITPISTALTTDNPPPTAIHCPHCRASLAIYDAIPIISYLWLQGKCRQCRHAISPQYLAIESISIVLTLMVVAVLGVGIHAVLALIFVWIGIALSAIDYQTKLLPDRLVLPLGMIGLVANSMGLFASASHAIFGAVAGFVLLWLINALYRLITNQDGMGLGDAKLLAAIGAWLGVWQLPMVLLIASTLGVMVGLHKRWRLGQNAAFAFGPCLVVAAIVSLLFGERLLAWLFSY